MSLSAAPPCSVQDVEGTPLSLPFAPNLSGCAEVAAVLDSAEEDRERCLAIAKTVADLYEVNGSTDASARAIQIRGMYAADAVYIDPLVEARGVDQVISSFNSISSVARSGGLAVVDSSASRGLACGDGWTVRMEGLASYRLRLFPITLTWRQFSTIKVGTSWLITKHEEHWSIESLISALPLVGRLYLGLVRPAASRIVHALCSHTTCGSAGNALLMSGVASAEADCITPVTPEAVSNLVMETPEFFVDGVFKLDARPEEEEEEEEEEETMTPGGKDEELSREATPDASAGVDGDGVMTRKALLEMYDISVQTPFRERQHLDRHSNDEASSHHESSWEEEQSREGEGEGEGGEEESLVIGSASLSLSSTSFMGGAEACDPKTPDKAACRGAESVGEQTPVALRKVKDELMLLFNEDSLLAPPEAKEDSSGLSGISPGALDTFKAEKEDRQSHGLEGKPAKEEEEEEEQEQEQEQEQGWRQGPEGLMILDKVLGTGTETLVKGSRVKVHYTMKLIDGTLVDSSRGRIPMTFRLGAGEVIKGWDIGLEGMKVGGVREMEIPPNFAYGERGAPPDIPPGATLLADVELLNCSSGLSFLSW